MTGNLLIRGICSMLMIYLTIYTIYKVLTL